MERYLTHESSEEDAWLDVAREVVDAIWEEHTATVGGDTASARSVLRSALMLEPNKTYLRFLDRKQTAEAKEALLRPRCLDLGARAPVQEPGGL